MKRHETIDPRIDRLIAALYGELSDEDRRDFDAQLAADPSLRAEWEELSGTRNLLAGWELEDRIPSFVVVEAAARHERRSPIGWLGALRERYGNWFSVGGWVMAGAAAAIMILTVKGVQVERTAHGIAVNFGSPDQPNGVGSRLAPDTGLNAVQQVSNNGGTAEGTAGTYLTRDEFDQYSAAMLRMMSAYMNDYRSRRDEEVGAALRSLYGNINARQSSQYEDLLGKIDAARPADPVVHQFLRPTELGMSHADSLGPLRLSPDDVEVGRNE